MFWYTVVPLRILQSCPIKTPWPGRLTAIMGTITTYEKEVFGKWHLFNKEGIVLNTLLGVVRWHPEQETFRPTALHVCCWPETTGYSLAFSFLNRGVEVLFLCSSDTYLWLKSCIGRTFNHFPLYSIKYVLCKQRRGTLLLMEGALSYIIVLFSCIILVWDYPSLPFDIKLDLTQAALPSFEKIVLYVNFKATFALWVFVMSLASLLVCCE